jgi:hypothetical protein
VGRWERVATHSSQRQAAKATAFIRRVLALPSTHEVTLDDVLQSSLDDEADLRCLFATDTSNSRLPKPHVGLIDVFDAPEVIRTTRARVVEGSDDHPEICHARVRSELGSLHRALVVPTVQLEQRRCSRRVCACMPGSPSCACESVQESYEEVLPSRCAPCQRRGSFLMA